MPDCVGCALFPSAYTTLFVFFTPYFFRLPSSFSFSPLKNFSFYQRPILLSGPSDPCQLFYCPVIKLVVSCGFPRVWCQCLVLAYLVRHHAAAACQYEALPFSLR